MSMESNMGPGPFYRDDERQEPGGLGPEILEIQRELMDDEQETGEQDEQ